MASVNFPSCAVPADTVKVEEVVVLKINNVDATLWELSTVLPISRKCRGATVEGGRRIRPDGCLILDIREGLIQASRRDA